MKLLVWLESMTPGITAASDNVTHTCILIQIQDAIKTRQWISYMDGRPYIRQTNPRKTNCELGVP